jgi:hypothetical protein
MYSVEAPTNYTCNCTADEHKLTLKNRNQLVDDDDDDDVAQQTPRAKIIISNSLGNFFNGKKILILLRHMKTIWSHLAVRLPSQSAARASGLLGARYD